MKWGLILVMVMSIALRCLSQGSYDTLPNLPDHYKQRLAKFKLEKVAEGKILFLGNSITEQGNWRKLLKDSSAINRGISGDNTFGVLKRLDEVAAHKPSRIFILIGVNDLSKNIPTARTIENIFTIVNKLHAMLPQTQIFVQSLLPVNPTIKDFQAKFSKQEGILEINGQLKKYGDAFKYTYIDIHAHFLNPQNLLDARFTHDGLHLNEAGYRHWVEFLKKSKFL